MVREPREEASEKDQRANGPLHSCQSNRAGKHIPANQREDHTSANPRLHNNEAKEANQRAENIPANQREEDTSANPRLHNNEAKANQQAENIPANQREEHIPANQHEEHTSANQRLYILLRPKPIGAMKKFSQSARGTHPSQSAQGTHPSQSAQGASPRPMSGCT